MSKQIVHLSPLPEELLATNDDLNFLGPYPFYHKFQFTFNFSRISNLSISSREIFLNVFTPIEHDVALQLVSGELDALTLLPFKPRVSGQLISGNSSVAYTPAESPQSTKITNFFSQRKKLEPTVSAPAPIDISPYFAKFKNPSQLLSTPQSSSPQRFSVTKSKSSNSIPTSVSPKHFETSLSNNFMYSKSVSKFMLGVKQRSTVGISESAVVFSGNKRRN